VKDKDKDWLTNGHSLGSYWRIFETKTGQEGYVSPCRNCDTPLAPYNGGK